MFTHHKSDAKADEDTAQKREGIRWVLNEHIDWHARDSRVKWHATLLDSRDGVDSDAIALDGMRLASDCKVRERERESK